jgi:hypothetical protein
MRPSHSANREIASHICGVAGWPCSNCKPIPTPTLPLKGREGRNAKATPPLTGERPGGWDSHTLLLPRGGGGGWHAPHPREAAGG